MSGRTVAGLVVVALAAACGELAGVAAGSGGPILNLAPSSPAQLLAELDAAGQRISPHDPRVKAIQFHMRSMRHKGCRESDGGLATDTVNAQSALHRAGFDVRLGRIISGVDTSLPRGGGRRLHGHCAKAFTSYVTLRKRRPH